ncbi:Na+/H+ antiporter subunit D [Paenibacillus radicis (ex Gao et al. 2016)]|uniref:Na+/H+ antiporter subunit D n=1 Tax=Paenibacillus radicis (ex Gao et al. 2016) TaxID=1737354 RepID=A0A917H4Z7_9BACL|nr:Na+/H+ antiporter subunit D [Paenibacillus radicis (ex Gao et al. 2016)]GGG67599.1 Na+/H+ antiporter subunit D [Paenibacillus radicis (ex Gao et al. 2016)]
MNNLLIAPVIIPLLTGMVLIIFQKNIMLQRILSLVALLATGVIAVLLMNRIKDGGIQSIQLGGWEAPFGISFVGDMFSALLLLATSIVAIGCLIYAFSSIGRKQEKLYFYPLFLFLITGVNGSFLTGDLFNLYVFFELFLVASYVLIALGGTQRQLRESLKYIFTNIIASAFFLIGIAYLYSMTGTLNLAHLSLRIAEIGQDGLITTVALLFLIVFAMKAGLLLFFWLPGSYSVPPTAIAAIFAALLTKVGIYAIFRMFTLIFYHEPQITHLFIGILAAITMILGGLGAIGFWDLRKILTYNVIISVGFIMAGLVSFTTTGIAGSIYYLIHDILIKALIFIIGGTIVHLTGTSDLRKISGLIRLHPQLGWMFFLAALSMVGIPPLSGFLGKVFTTQGVFESGYYWLGAIGLLASLFILYSMIKLFMNAFWGETILSEDEEKGTTKGLLFPIALLTVASVAMGIGAEAITGYVDQAAEQLLNPSLYIQAVFE